MSAPVEKQALDGAAPALEEEHGARRPPAGPAGDGQVSDAAEEEDRSAGLFRELAGLFAMDYRYRQRTLSLTASENYPSVFVRLLGSGLHGGFYHFDPPYDVEAGEWSFPDSGGVNAMVRRLRSLGMALFEARTFDWRPNGGSVAEQALMLGVCSRGDALVHFAHGDGGPFALDDLARKTAI